MSMGECSFFFPSTTLAKGLILVLPSLAPLSMSVWVAIAFSLLLSGREDLDLFRLDNIENNYNKPHKVCHGTAS
jgi:hypothetical protein